MNWLKERRKELKLTLEDVAMKLQLEGFDFTPGAISHWEHERHQPPLGDEKFRRALSKILRLNVRKMLQLAGYEVYEPLQSSISEQISFIVSDMSIEEQKTALRILKAMKDESHEFELG